MPTYRRSVSRSSAAIALTVLAIAVTVGVTGCGGDATSSSTTSEAAASKPGPDQQPGDVGQLAPLAFQAIRSPIPFEGSDDKTHLDYQLSLQNGGPVPTKINEVAVVDGDDQGKAVASFSGPALTSKLALLASPIEPLTSATLESSQAGAFWVDAVFDNADEVPATLEHSITATPIGESFYKGRDTVTAAPIGVSEDQPARLGAPLSGDNWINMTGCCTGVPNHRHALFPVGGQLYDAQEFAIDFMRLDSKRRLFAGDQTDSASYTAYDAPVLAVSDATVVATSDGLPDQVPGDPDPVPAEQADGNFVMLDLGDGRYANYAHLQRGTIIVKPGDQVESGQRLAKIGNSGQTGVPHLHFHVMDRPLLAEAVGLPYEFESFDVQGVADLNSVDRAVTDGAAARVEPTGAGPHENQLPLELTVLNFP